MSERAGRSYTYEGGNIASALGGGEDPRYYEFDSADRLVCVSSSPAETCDVLEVWYDAAGNRVREETGDTVREFLGHHHVFEDNPNTLGIERSEITAFGEVVATVVSDRVQASVWPAYPAGETPPWLYAAVGVLPAGLLGWLLLLALRGGLVVGVARRPTMATVSAVAIVVLVSPHHAMGGGGGNTERSYRWIMSDALGSSVAVFDEQGVLLHQTRYAPFGSVDAEYELAPDPYERDFYAGHPTQDETGLVYMRARWMDPQTGTFISVDPLVDLRSPQYHHPYSYAANNPMSSIDPTGEAAFWIPGELTPDGIAEVIVTPDVPPTGAVPTSLPGLGSGELAGFGLGVPGNAINYALDAPSHPSQGGSSPASSTELAQGGDGAGRGDPHGDAGRALQKAEQQITELEKRLEDLKRNQGSRREKQKLQDKIDHIRRNAERLKKGETHWRRGAPRGGRGFRGGGLMVIPDLYFELREELYRRDPTSDLPRCIAEGHCV